MVPKGVGPWDGHQEHKRSLWNPKQLTSMIDLVDSSIPSSVDSHVVLREHKDICWHQVILKNNDISPALAASTEALDIKNTHVEFIWTRFTVFIFLRPLWRSTIPWWQSCGEQDQLYHGISMIIFAIRFEVNFKELPNVWSSIRAVVCRLCVTSCINNTGEILQNLKVRNCQMCCLQSYWRSHSAQNRRAVRMKPSLRPVVLEDSRSKKTWRIERHLKHAAYVI